MIELRDLSKRYATPRGGVAALAGVSLAARPGEIVAVRGPSCCGKTTLLLTAGGLIRPDGGQVMIDGQDVYGLSARARAQLRARTIGFVFQQFHLVPYLSVLENVLTPSLAAGSAGNADGARQTLERFGLSGRLDHLPSDLSTGERQRVALARALLNGPKVLLADEPTGNLDDASAKIVLETLRAFAAAGGAVLLVTHDPLAVPYAHRCLRMEHGKVGA